MNYYFYNHSIKFKSVLNDIINYYKNIKCKFVVEEYSNINDILYLNPNIYYGCDYNFEDHNNYMGN